MRLINHIIKIKIYLVVFIFIMSSCSFKNNYNMKEFIKNRFYSYSNNAFSQILKNEKDKKEFNKFMEKKFDENEYDIKYFNYLYSSFKYIIESGVLLKIESNDSFENILRNTISGKINPDLFHKDYMTFRKVLRSLINRLSIQRSISAFKHIIISFLDKKLSEEKTKNDETKEIKIENTEEYRFSLLLDFIINNKDLIFKEMHKKNISFIKTTQQIYSNKYINKYKYNCLTDDQRVLKNLFASISNIDSKNNIERFSYDNLIKPQGLNIGRFAQINRLYNYLIDIDEIFPFFNVTQLEDFAFMFKIRFDNNKKYPTYLFLKEKYDRTLFRKCLNNIIPIASFTSFDFMTLYKFYNDEKKRKKFTRENNEFCKDFDKKLIDLKNKIGGAFGYNKKQREFLIGNCFRYWMQNKSSLSLNIKSIIAMYIYSYCDEKKTFGFLKKNIFKKHECRKERVSNAAPFKSFPYYRAEYKIISNDNHQKNKYFNLCICHKISYYLKNLFNIKKLSTNIILLREIIKHLIAFKYYMTFPNDKIEDAVIIEKNKFIINDYLIFKPFTLLNDINKKILNIESELMLEHINSHGSEFLYIVIEVCKTLSYLSIFEGKKERKKIGKKLIDIITNLETTLDKNNNSKDIIQFLNDISCLKKAMKYRLYKGN